MEGVLLRRKGSLRLVISIELIQRSVAVDADAADVEAVSPARVSGPERFGISKIRSGGPHPPF
jgi:hypothetical protein